MILSLFNYSLFRPKKNYSVFQTPLHASTHFTTFFRIQGIRKTVDLQNALYNMTRVHMFGAEQEIINIMIMLQDCKSSKLTSQVKMCRSKHPFFLYKMNAPKSLEEVNKHTRAHAKRQLSYTSQFILIRKQTEQTRNEAKSSIWSTSQFALKSKALYVKLSSQIPRSQQQPWPAIQQRQHGLLQPPWAVDGLP